MSKVIKPTKEDQVTLDRKVYKSFVREIAEEMFRRSTMQWNYHDLHDIMGDGKRLPKAQKMYRQHYDFVRTCLRRHYINQEEKMSADLSADLSTDLSTDLPKRYILKIFSEDMFVIYDQKEERNITLYSKKSDAIKHLDFLESIS